MNIRTSIRHHVASAMAALAVSAFVLGAAVSPTVSAPGAPASVQQGIA